MLRIFEWSRPRSFTLTTSAFIGTGSTGFHDNAPLYAQISRGGLIFHLSEHYGDGSPGAAFIVTIGDVGVYTES